MRDRRNTNLSISSTSSTGSEQSATFYPSVINEKSDSTSSPLRSPTLPLSATKENTRLRSQTSRLLNRWRPLALVCVIFILWTCLFGWPRSIPYPLHGSDSANDSEEPSALLTFDHAGHSKWTVAIPPNASFPLSGQQYKHICTTGESLSAQLHKDSRLDSSLNKLGRWRPRRKYNSIDRAYLDVADTERNNETPLQASATPGQPTCAKSLTFSLDTTDASFGKSLLMLWLSYGLAKKEGRAFFLDDTRWPYGKYSLYFAHIPLPDCAPPPPHHIVPCPHHARHIIVSAATAHWTFGEAFHEAFTLSRKHGAEKFRPIYDLIRKGYEDLFHLIGEDANYATTTINQNREEARKNGSKTVGVHIRRGDLRPLEYQFAHDYLPLGRYGAEARKLLHTLQTSSSQRQHAHNKEKSTQKSPSTDTTVDALVTHSLSSPTPLLVASDDPDVLSIPPDLAHSALPFTFRRAQGRIHLATKSALDQASPAESIRTPGSPYVKHVDENAGWEGGFYSALFYALGRPRRDQSTLATPDSQHQVLANSGEVTEDMMRLRELVGRAYLLDLAVLSQGDAVVCAVSSAACRLLGVMLGWDKMKAGAWANIDDGRGWSWNGKL